MTCSFPDFALGVQLYFETSVPRTRLREPGKTALRKGQDRESRWSSGGFVESSSL
jgi:hypothetical protein